MDRLFSATEEKDQELTEQVANDIEAAKDNGSVDTDELKYVNLGEGKVAITDLGNGEVTIAEKADDGNYDLYPAEMSQQIEGFIHPEGDGVTPGPQVGAPDEHYEEHMDPQAQVEEHVNPEAGNEPSVEGTAEAGREPRAEDAEDQVCPECGKNPCECAGEEKEFSVSTDNEVVLRIFSDQEFCEKVFSEVLESEETAKVGDLKVEKVDDDSVVVTSESTGDQAKVTLDGDEMEVTELDSKNFSSVEEDSEAFSPAAEDYDDQFLPMHVVGVDSFNHVIVDAPVYSEEDAQELVARLQEEGVDAVQVFDTFEEARDYAADLLNGLDATDVDEPEEATFSDTDDFDLYVTRYYSDNTVYMDRLFSEAANDVETSQEVIEDAIENGEQIENESEIVTPVDMNTAVIEDKENEEFTKVTLNDDELHFRPIGESEAEELTSHLEVDSEGAGHDSDPDRVEEGREETKDFSEYEDEYDEDERDFSEYGDEDYEDEREFSEYEDEYDEDERDFSEYEDEYDESDYIVDRYFSDTDEEIYTDEEETKFFSEEELMTEYMVRLFSDEADSEKIEDAIESGEEIENDDEIITPVDANTAVIEDKDNGEFTKAEMNEGEIELHPISEEEAEELTNHLAVEDDEPKEEKKFSTTLDKFFADAGLTPEAQAAAVPQTAEFIVDEQGNPIQPVEAPVDPSADPNAAAQPVMTPEAIEDKAVAAVQSIQAAAAEAEAQIMNAKAAPVEGAQQDLQEAQFSDYYDDEEERTFSETDTLVSWLETKE
jgi:hypothetical protein